MMLACGDMSSMILAFLGTLAAGGLVMGTLTSTFIAALAEDKRAFLAMPLFSVLWAFGIFQLLT